MPLMIEAAEGGAARPVIVCDHCGKEAAGAGDGNGRELGRGWRSAFSDACFAP